ncbi:class I SAM-dependent methyltransferase [Solirubrobacter phytolaccae]|uniref:Class I SAM-dependent methyltransferase n=1 Tax=Solirubrobacter phytolaccae TaxID=1404360 RepID=A0A9X3SE17_9ACTN|nr:class I SAM-dependent methyltransferase [Solirubrobacter phytolaccae]MDA0184355.1 class I SAM-dependent methyltransferase [Solirubrobacter phytolaccae]
MTDDDARAAYDVLAPVYDLVTAGHDHAAWASQLEALARGAGLRGTRLLDLGCGTGLSMLPMRERGYEVTGIDVSTGMLEGARDRLGPDVRLEVHDLRSLPVLGAFDLIWSVADGFNCLLDDGELIAAFTGVRRNLAPGGVLVFDVDTLASFRSLYSSLIVAPGAAGVAIFDGQAESDLGPDEVAEAIVERLQPGAEPPWWTRARAVHRQRHHSRATLERALAAAGLSCVGVWGTDFAGVPGQPLDEARHNKAVYLAREA